MIKDLNQYIDVCIIDEYADKSFSDGYTLDVDDLKDHDRDNFLAELMRHDTTVRDLVLYHMQELINKRLIECEANDKYDSGLRLVRMSNGDSRLSLRQGVA